MTNDPRRLVSRRTAGEDVDAGELLFSAGHRLQPADVALLRATGHRRVEVVEQPRVSIIPTGAEALRDAIRGDTEHDLIATTGGTSVGDRDLIDEVVENIGEVLVHSVAIKPGHPVGVGVVDGTPLGLLPGYPVSCPVNAVQFLRPAVAWQAGEIPESRDAIPAGEEVSVQRWT